MAFCNKIESYDVQLPDSVVEAIGENLRGTDLMSAICVSRRWREILAPLVRHVIVSPRHWGNQVAAKSRSSKLAASFLGVEGLQVWIDGNRVPKNMPGSLLVACIEPFASCKKLVGLSVHVRTAIMPNEGYEDVYFQNYILRWTSLATNVADGVKELLPTLGLRLQTLDLNTQCNMLGLLMPHLSALSALTKLRYTLSDHYTISADDCRVLGALTTLQSLSLHSWLPPPLSADLSTALSSLTRLTYLDVEAVSIPPEDSVVTDIGFLRNLKELQVLCIKGLGMSNATAVSAMSQLKEVTLTMTEAMDAAAWLDLDSLSSLTSLNINAWSNMAPTPEGALTQRVQSFEGIPLAVTRLKALGIKLQGAKDLKYIGQLHQLEDLILAFNPAASGVKPEHSSAVSTLASLTNLKRLDIFDTGGHIKLTQSLLESMDGWWPNLEDLYFEGTILVRDMSRVQLKKLQSLDLRAVANTNMFSIDAAYLPTKLAHIGLQNAVFLYDPAKAVPVHKQLTSVSFMKGVMWVDQSKKYVCDWMASCSVLTNVCIEFNMAWWADELELRSATGATPLAPLCGAPMLKALDVMFVESSDASEGSLDTRLIQDLARIPKLEELELWTRAASDWHEDLSFLPFLSCRRLRVLKVEVLTMSKCVVVKDLMLESLPNCRLRLVANHVGDLQ